MFLSTCVENKIVVWLRNMLQTKKVATRTVTLWDDKQTNLKKQLLFHSYIRRMPSNYLNKLFERQRSKDFRMIKGNGPKLWPVMSIGLLHRSIQKIASRSQNSRSRVCILHELLLFVVCHRRVCAFRETIAAHIIVISHSRHIPQCTVRNKYITLFGNNMIY